VLILDPQGKFDPQVLLCTDQAVTATQIIQWFALRWQVEVTFHEVRSHLGVETQRQWSDLAILRTTPALLDWGVEDAGNNEVPVVCQAGSTQIKRTCQRERIGAMVTTKQMHFLPEAFLPIC
jgi:hypothetical protein